MPHRAPPAYPLPNQEGGHLPNQDRARAAPGAQEALVPALCTWGGGRRGEGGHQGGGEHRHGATAAPQLPPRTARRCAALVARAAATMGKGRGPQWPLRSPCGEGRGRRHQVAANPAHGLQACTAAVMREPCRISAPIHGRLQRLRLKGTPRPTLRPAP
jgi:hypothetical protein